MTNPHREMPLQGLAWKRWVFALAAVSVLAGCDLQTAGTSVGTGNPTEIEVAFKNDSGAVSLTGTLNVYASTQIPVPGFSPQPLISIPVTAADHGLLKAEAFKALADSLWPKTSIENGVYHFNVVVLGDSQGTVLKGFSFRKADGRFLSLDGDSARGGSDLKDTVMGRLTPLVDIQVSLDTGTVNDIWDYYLFVFGTGFAGKGVRGHFTLRKIPFGEYPCNAVVLPNDHHQVGGLDSVGVFGIDKPLAPGIGTLILGPQVMQVPLPASFKIP